MLGRLTFDAIPKDLIVLGGVATMGFGVLLIVGVLTYFKRWKWLWREYMTSLDPKKIGVMYLVVAIVMLLRGLGDALLIRIQQALSAGDSGGDSPILTIFSKFFSAHGTMMIFFVAMGVIFAMMNLLVPLMIGARDVAFPF